MDKITTRRTSQATADVTEVVLRELETRRLVFRPMLVDNPKDARAGVSGVFLYQKKGKNDEWEDFETIPLTKVHKGEGYKLDLSSAETLELFDGLKSLYEIKERYGLRPGAKQYVPAEADLLQLMQLPDDQLRTMLEANQRVGEDFVTKLIAWAMSERRPAELIKRLSETAPDTLRMLNTSANVERLRDALREWREHADNADERFWQQLVAKHSFVLEQVFSFPVTIVEKEAYVGGTQYDRKGAGMVDFLVKNDLTNNAALVEVKPPAADLLGEEYRTKIYNVSKDLSGGVQQVLNYERTLMLDYDRIVRDRNQEDMFQVFAPRCVVLIGAAKKEFGQSKSKRKSFELYRKQLSGVTVVTFDEVTTKTENLIAVLESTGE